MIAWLLLAACTQTVPHPAGTLTLAYSGNVDGDIEPCG